MSCQLIPNVFLQDDCNKNLRKIQAKFNCSQTVFISERLFQLI